MKIFYGRYKGAVFKNIIKRVEYNEGDKPTFLRVYYER